MIASSQSCSWLDGIRSGTSTLASSTSISSGAGNGSGRSSARPRVGSLATIVKLCSRPLLLSFRGLERLNAGFAAGFLAAAFCRRPSAISDSAIRTYAVDLEILVLLRSAVSLSPKVPQPGFACSSCSLRYSRPSSSRTFAYFSLLAKNCGASSMMRLSVTCIASWCESSASTSTLLSGFPVVGVAVVASAEFGWASISSTSAANCGGDTRASGAGVITSVAIWYLLFVGPLAAQHWWFWGRLSHSDLIVFYSGTLTESNQVGREKRLATWPKAGRMRKGWQVGSGAIRACRFSRIPSNQALAGAALRKRGAFQ